MKKRIISLILCLVMLTGSAAVMGTPVSAAVTSSHGMLPFDDITADAWYVEGLTFCYVNKIISGQNAYTFNPDGALTRGAFAVMLAMAARAELTGYINTKFADVIAGQWYTAAVSWAAEKGFMAGTGNSYFSPNGVMTREQFATVAMRYMQTRGHEVSVDPDALNEYQDANNISDWATEGMKYAISAGIISGTSTTVKMASPKMTVSRSQAARIFMVVLKDYDYSACEHRMTVATCTEGSFCAECGMVETLPNGHKCDTLDCKTDGKCNICGEKVNADTGLHNFTAATCTQAKTCTVCKATRGIALGHTTDNGKCARCGAVNFTTTYDKVAYFTMTRGSKQGDHAYYVERHDKSDKGNSVYTTLTYDSKTEEFTVKSYYYYANHHYDSFEFSLGRNTSKCIFTYKYFDDEFNKTPLLSGTGDFDSSMVTKSTVLSFEDYNGKPTYKATALSNSKSALSNSLKAVGDMINTFYGGSVSDLGFYMW